MKIKFDMTEFQYKPHDSNSLNHNLYVLECLFNTLPKK